MPEPMPVCSVAGHGQRRDDIPKEDMGKSG